MFDIFDEINRITRAYALAHGLPEPPPLKPDLGFEIPVSIRRRKCSECRNEAIPDSDLCWYHYAKNAVPEPWKEDDNHKGD